MIDFRLQKALVDTLEFLFVFGSSEAWERTLAADGTSS
jgi:hypothetical protein